MKVLSYIWILVICTPMVLSQCSKPKEIQCAGTVSFKNDILPMLRTNCATAGCHTGPNPTGSLNMDSARAYREIVGDGYTIAGKPGYSILYNKMLGTGGVPIMPPSGKLPQSTTDMVYCWILEGAQDN